MYILVFRLSIFGDFSPFYATSENIVAWTEGFRELGYEFLPSVFSIQQEPDVGGLYIGVAKVPEEKRLQFISADGKCVVRILPNRLDVEFSLSTVDDTQLEQNLEEKIGMSLKIMEFLLRSMDDKKGNRLAYYLDVLLPEPEEKSFAKFYKNNNLGLFEDDSIWECAEWSHRTNNKTKLEIDSDIDELCNLILTTEAGLLRPGQMGENPSKIISGLRVSADINTLAEKSAERFSIHNLKCFVGNAQETYLALLEELKSKIHNE